MWYLIGLVSGFVVYITILWLNPFPWKDIEKDMKFSKFSSREIKFYVFSGFIVFTFLFGPFISYSYLRRITYEGQEAFLDHAIFMTVFVLMWFFISFLYNRKDAKNIIITSWKSILIIYLVFAFSFGWLIPILYKWFAG
jgi:hypothetical protein